MRIHQPLLSILLISIIALLPKLASGQQLQSGPQVLTFFSDADDTEQPYGLYLPKNYDPQKKYPLVMMLHGAGSNHRLALRRVFGKSNAEGETDAEATRYFPAWEDVEYIVASPYARGTAGYQGIPEEDVYDVLDDVKKRFNIDENRVYLTGLSMGGGGTLWLGLTRPDIWAAIAPVCPAPPAGTMDLAINALNFPVHFFHGDADPVVPVAGTRKWVSDMQDMGVEVFYKEFADVKHDSWVNAYDNEFIFEWFGPAVREPFPNKVRFVSKLYKYNKAFWVQFDKISYGMLAEIDANFTKQNSIIIKSKNLESLSLNLAGHPRFKAGEDLSIEIDGVSLKTKTDSSVSIGKTNNKWAIVSKEFGKDILQKRKGAEGPIYDAFSSRQVYVYGTLDNPAADELARRVSIANKAADWSQNRGPFLGRVLFFPMVLSDKELRKSDIETSNLILFGTKETNSIIAQHAAKLPLHLNVAAKDYGLLYIFPIGNRYVAVNSGLPWWEGAANQGFPFVPVAHRKLSGYKDVLLFKSNSSNVVAEGYFSEFWKLSGKLKESVLQPGVVTVTE
ncbi:alpha/beta hydrolase-fold protein [Dyadobacter sp. CY312]|uniref:carboxylesterase family protein n=1 Tax=Dyadobacter sp. CY312 TaxID=2907303 RepID=UPI001EEB1EF8|nr:alpha/beta hydrolase-fold protein [Dyadobacter sp. CY312]MCE7039835.1 phospholipase [Dyadobacter sp. CY312]